MTTEKQPSAIEKPEQEPKPQVIEVWMIVCRNGSIHRVNDHPHYRLAILSVEQADRVVEGFQAADCAPHRVVKLVEVVP